MLKFIERDLAKIVVPIDWKYDDLSDLETLIILLEDRRYFNHRGVDLISIGRECFKMLTFRKFGGASTIDMQFVRMRTGYCKRTLWRKCYEMILAWLLQSKMDKIQILRAYLDEMFLGSGIYGIDRAAKIMFGKERYELTREEAATIAAMMVYPRPLKPTTVWESRVQRRAKYGLFLFAKLAHEYRRNLEE